MGVERTKPSATAVLIIDVQDNLAAAIPTDRMAKVQRAAAMLLGAAAELGAPVIATELDPATRGPTTEGLRDRLAQANIEAIEKLTFSASNEPSFVQQLKTTGAEAVLVLGLETHVSVFQTVRDLAARGLRVDVVVDGVASRCEEHRQVGLQLCERAGANLTTAETVLFDWMVQCGTETYRKVAALAD